MYLVALNPAGAGRLSGRMTGDVLGGMKKGRETYPSTPLWSSRVEAVNRGDGGRDQINRKSTIT